MEAHELIQYIAASEKKTPVKLLVREKAPIDYGSSKVFGAGDKVVFGDWKELGPILRDNQDKIEDLVVAIRQSPFWTSRTPTPESNQGPLSGNRWRSETGRLS